MSFTDMLKGSNNGVEITQKVQKTKNECPCCVKITTYKKGYNDVEAGKEVILYDGKPYYGCTRPLYDGGTMCYKHSKVEDPLLYENILNEGEVLTTSHIYFDKYRTKIEKKGVQPSSKTEFIFKVSLKDKELINQIQEIIKKFNSNDKSHNSSMELDDTTESPFETSLKPDDVIECNDVKDDSKEIVNKLMNDTDEEDIPAPVLELNNSSESCSDSDSNSEMEADTITTKPKYGSRELGITRHDNNVYDVDDPEDSILLGKLMIVDDSKAPILDEGNNCIVGIETEMQETIKDEFKNKSTITSTYIKCSLSDRVYHVDTLEKKGVANNSNGTWCLKSFCKK